MSEYSYAGRKCRCNREKLPDTLVCDDCMNAAPESSRRIYQDTSNSRFSRRHAAQIILTLARKRRSP